MLSSNHIELFLLDSDLLFELFGHLLKNSRHVSKGGCLWTEIWRLGLDDGGVLIIHLNPSDQQIVVDRVDCSYAGLSVSVDPSGSIRTSS